MTLAAMRIAPIRRFNTVLILVLFATLLYALFPGRFDADGYSMWLQSADLRTATDWQSPLMIVALAITRRLVAGPAILFVVQLATWLFGVWLLTDAVIRRGRRWAGLAITGGCAVPLVSFIFVDVNKDTALAALGMVLLGVLARAALLGRRPGRLGYAGLFALGVVFVDVRHNAFIALAPLVAGFLFLVAPALRRSPARWLAASLLILAALTGIDQVIKYDVIHVAHSHEERALAMFDIAGVTTFSHADASGGLLGPDFVARDAACYTPKYHDPFEWGACHDVGARMAAIAQTKAGRRLIYRQWLAAIEAHPAAYLQHRLAFFNVFLRVNCTRCKDGMTAGVLWPRPWRLVPQERVSEPGALMDRAAVWLYRSHLGRGVVWLSALAASLAELGARARSAPLGRVEVFVVAVVASALLYPLTLFPLGVAFAQRYLHWTVMLAVVAVPMTVSLMARGRSSAQTRPAAAMPA